MGCEPFVLAQDKTSCRGTGLVFLNESVIAQRENAIFSDNNSKLTDVKRSSP